MPVQQVSHLHQLLHKFIFKLASLRLHLLYVTISQSHLVSASFTSLYHTVSLHLLSLHQSRVAWLTHSKPSGPPPPLPLETLLPPCPCQSAVRNTSRFNAIFKGFEELLFFNLELCSLKEISLMFAGSGSGRVFFIFFYNQFPLQQLYTQY